MNLSPEHLKLFLQLAAVGQCCLAGVNLGLVPLMHWKDDLKRLPLLLREVFQVHLWFITITVGIFGTTTWRFAGELSTGGKLGPGMVGRLYRSVLGNSRGPSMVLLQQQPLARPSRPHVHPYSLHAWIRRPRLVVRDRLVGKLIASSP